MCMCVHCGYVSLCVYVCFGWVVFLKPLLPLLNSVHSASPQLQNHTHTHTHTHTRTHTRTHTHTHTRHVRVYVFACARAYLSQSAFRLSALTLTALSLLPSACVCVCSLQKDPLRVCVFSYVCTFCSTESPYIYVCVCV